ncbi:hypothetical protein [uncultured Ferrimonas sp.]|uniref:hypothetical protein n=1 Tax=uncultured Ferrimonas sp. TaxID=432640 RepID=UPI002628E960|nr:hypothetical protein [uncultured Ferrimonas sp.]
MDRVKITMLAIFLGVLYAYLSVYIIGIGAAVAIPASILTPVAKAYPTFAFAMVDLITIGFPLLIVYFLFVLIVKYFNSSNSYFPYLALLVPFFIQHIYLFVIMGQPQDLAYTLATIMPRYIAILLFALYFVKRAVNHAKA